MLEGYFPSIASSSERGMGRVFYMIRKGKSHDGSVNIKKIRRSEKLPLKLRSFP